MNMAILAQCQECESIREQYTDALVEIRALPNIDVVAKIAEIEQTGQLVGKFPSLPLSLPKPKYPRITDAVRRAETHWIRTGHSALAPKRA
jgi:hypothetical protein